MKITCMRKRSRLATLLLALVLVPAMMLGVVSTLSQPAKAGGMHPITVTDGIAKLGGTTVVQAAAGQTIQLVANPAPTGKVFDAWVTLEGINLSDLADKTSPVTTFTMPDKPVNVKAMFKPGTPTTYSLNTSVNGGHGTISPSKTNIMAGSMEAVVFTPEPGYEIDKVTVNGSVANVTGDTLNIAMDSDKTVVVTYKKIAGGGNPAQPGNPGTPGNPAQPGQPARPAVNKNKGKSPVPAAPNTAAEA